MSEEDLRQLVRRAAHDESIVDVARFNPRGLAGTVIGGGIAGGIAGNAVGGDFGRSLGSLTAASAGAELEEAMSGLPLQIVVGVSPSEVYVFGGVSKIERHRKEEVLTPIAVIDRARLGVEVHQRLAVRTLTLVDLDSGQSIELESPRLNLYHSKALMELLMLSDEHLDVQDRR